MRYSARLALFGTILAAALLAACGGGGGGGGASLPPSGGGGSVATPPAYAMTGVMSDGVPLANAPVVFTCGCTQQAGLTTTDGAGAYTIGATATAIPASPDPTYTTVPGRNYLVIGFAPNHAQFWTMEFLGAVPAHNLNLSDAPNDGAANIPDAASTAASLYIFYESSNAPGDESFDLWNFNAIDAWARHLRAGSALSAAETRLLADVTQGQTSGASLFPAIPQWNPDASATPNATIRADLDAVRSESAAGANPSVPTPCPALGACTGTPTP